MEQHIIDELADRLRYVRDKLYRGSDFMDESEQKERLYLAICHLEEALEAMVPEQEVPP